MTAKFGIVKNFKIFGIISILLVIVGLVALVGAPFGLNLFNLDIDFVGGTTMYYSLNKDITAQDVDLVNQVVMDAIGVNASSVQIAGGGDEIIIKTKDIDLASREAIYDGLVKQFAITVANRLNVDNVSPSVGKELRNSAFKAAGVAMLLMLLYIWFRFDWRSGLAAVICLLHDVLVMTSFCVIAGWSINGNFIAAALIIFGYSINASIITFDRIRENHRLSRREDESAVVDRSIWQTMTRNINTTITTLFTIVALFILGVPSIRNFALPIIIGIISGAYSSIFLAGPLWAQFKKLGKEKQS